LQSIEPLPTTPGGIWGKEIDDYFSKWAYSDMAFNNIILEGGSDEAAINAEVSTYWENQFPKMVMAQNPDEVERIWRESLEEILSMGLQDVIDARNVMFQRNKGMLGQDFAYPSNMK
jgi:hypothetical protein